MSGTKFSRAADRARAVLQPGDKLSVRVCGGRLSTVTMVGWSDDFPDFVASKSLSADELHPINIEKVNGRPVSFVDPSDM